MSTLNHGYGVKLEGLSASDKSIKSTDKLMYVVELDPYFGEGCRILPHSIMHKGQGAYRRLLKSTICGLRTADGQTRVSWIFLN